MRLFKRTNTLYLNTSFTLAFGLVCFSLLSGVLVFSFILSPMANRAADDLGGLMHIVSKSWVALPIDKKQAFKMHLQKQHHLFITDKNEPVTDIEKFFPFIPRLEKALFYHTGQKVTVMQSVADRECYWIEVPHGTQFVKIGFFHDRIGPHPLKAIIGIAIVACFLIILITILMVRRITRPIMTLSDAVKLLRAGKLSTRIPESGSEELVVLAQNFNRMVEEISLLLTNRNLLFGGISHDLRTPITRMNLALELIEGEENTTYILGMRNDLAEMETLIKHTLELIKGMDKYQSVAVDIDDEIEGIIFDYQRQGHKIQWENNSCGMCDIEVNAFRRVMCNLLDNAFHYGMGYPVILECLVTDNCLKIKIIDQGEGIPNDKLDVVFQPFYRLDNSRSKKTGGSGLGLAIVKQLCDIHEWNIQLVSGDRVGLEVCLDIPVMTPVSISSQWLKG